MHTRTNVRMHARIHTTFSYYIMQADINIFYSTYDSTLAYDNFYCKM